MIYKCTNRVSGSDLSQSLALWPLRGQMDNLRNDASCAEPKETTNSLSEVRTLLSICDKKGNSAAPQDFIEQKLDS